MGFHFVARMKILITGASSGIGKACAQKCLENNFEVVAVARDFKKCEINHPLFTSYNIDLSHLDLLEANLKEVSKKHPDIDALVLSAGKGLFGHLEQLKGDAIRSLIDLNLTSQVLITKIFLPTMKKQHKGTIVFIGSEAALEGKTQGSIYCASKFALRGFSQSLRKECAKGGVRICLINPGMVKTPFFDSLHFCHGSEKDFYCSAEEIANAIFSQLSAHPSLVFDEINLSPLKHQVIFE